MKISKAMGGFFIGGVCLVYVGISTSFGFEEVGGTVLREHDSRSLTSCQVPNQLNKMKIIFISDSAYRPSHPYADIVSQIDFSDNSLSFIDLKTHTSLVGRYRYQQLAQNVGSLKGTDMVGSNLVDYGLVFVCQSLEHGTYIYYQKSEDALHDIYQLTGVYYIIP